MNSVVEKLAAIEKEIATIQPKMAPLTERIVDLDQKITHFARQLTSIAEESAAVKHDIELTRQSLSRIQTLIGESKVESEQLVAGQEANLQRCETMTAVFGAAFQAVSQFFETAQRMGLADQAQAIFLNPISAPMPTAPPVTSATPPPVMELPNDESTLSDSDFEVTKHDFCEPESVAWSMPDLPNVAAPLEIDSVHSDSDSAALADAEPASEIASQLEVLPLDLSIPALPELSESAELEDDDQEIEAMLATMMAPVTATAGS
jgi:regulator of replication initiation timing